MELLFILSVGVFSYSVCYLILYILKFDKIIVSQRVNKLISKSKTDEAYEKDSKRISINLESKNKHFASEKLKEELQSAGIIMRPEEFLIAWLGIAVLPMAIVFIISKNIIIAIIIATICAMIPPIIVARTKVKRVELFSKQLGEALPIIGNSLRSGFTFQQSMENISNNMPEPLAYEFGKTMREMNYGMPFEEALLRLGKRMDNKDLDLLISAVMIQSKVGGNLAELVDIIGETIKDRVKIKRDIKTVTSSGRLSGIILGVLPIALVLLLLVINPKYLMGFFSSSLGIMMIFVAIAMEVVGFLVILKITNIKY